MRELIQLASSCAICRRRCRKKNSGSCLEAEAEVRRIIERIGRGRGFDLEAVEAALRAAVLVAGRGCLSAWWPPVGKGRNRRRSAVPVGLG